MSFKDFLEELDEETTSGDIANVEMRLGNIKKKQRKFKFNFDKTKRCKLHKRINCQKCNNWE